MKKIILLLILVIFIAGCGSDNAIDKEDMEEDNDIEDVKVEVKGQVEEEWCTPGASYSVNTVQGSSLSVIKGFEIYKGKKLCKAQSETSVQGMDISTTYYFSYEGEEVYFISTVDGQTTEVHIINGEVVS